MVSSRADYLRRRICWFPGWLDLRWQWYADYRIAGLPLPPAYSKRTGRYGHFPGLHVARLRGDRLSECRYHQLDTCDAAADRLAAGRLPGQQVEQVYPRAFDAPGAGNCPGDFGLEADLAA